MKRRYGYLVLALFLVLLVGILWYSFSRKSVALPPVAQSSPSATATTTHFESADIDLTTLQPPSGWRVLNQSATSATFTDLPANAIIYDNATTSDRLIVDDDTLGYSTMGIRKITKSGESAGGWASDLAPKTDPAPGRTLETINNKVVEREIYGAPEAAIGMGSLVYADTSTIYSISLDPYQPEKVRKIVTLSSSTIQAYKSFIANFVGQLP